MVFILARFWLPLALACVYAIRRGGAPEKTAAGMLATAGLATIAVEHNLPTRFASVEIGVMIVDMALLAGLLVLMTEANRWWPILLTALQMMTVLGHLGKWLNPQIMQLAYAIMLFVPAYPGILVLAVGTYRHRRRLRQNGADASWSV